MGDAESLAAKLRGEAEGNMSLSFVDDLQEQVEKLEKEILKAEAAGKETEGDRVALLHLKALIEHLRASEKSPESERATEGGLVAPSEPGRSNSTVRRLRKRWC